MVADRTFLRRFVAVMYVSANSANPNLFFFSLNVNILNILGFMDVYATFLKLNAAFSDNIAKFAW